MAKNRLTRKAERARDRPDRDENEDGSQSIAGLDVRHVGILAQTLAVFVAVSTLMGRIHSLTYYKTLGIPTSEIRLSVTDYSVVSPETTTFGVGFSIIIAIHFWSNWLQALKKIPRSVGILVGIILLIAGISFGVYTFSSQQSDVDSVGLIIQILMLLAIFSFGITILLASLFPKNGEQSELSRAIMPLTVVLLICYSVWVGSQFSSTIGRADALNTWVTAPVASIELAPSSVLDPLRYGSEECSSDSLGNCYRVILISDKFVYLRPLDTETPGERLYALPIGDIAGITYVSAASTCPNKGC